MHPSLLPPRRARGATLAELLIVVGLIGLFAALVLLAAGRFVLNGNEHADADARAFGQSLGLDVKAAVCTATDTDGDGYLSCTISVQKGAEVEIIPVECARAHLTLAEGCRMQRTVVNGRVRR